VRVLGVDPGLTRCGLAIVEASPGNRGSLIHLEVATTDSKTEPSERLFQIAARVDWVLDQFTPDAVSLERLFAQQNLKTVMGVAQVSGIVLLAARKREISVTTYTPTAVKAAVTGSGRSDKKQMGTMVAKLLNLPEIPKPADAADAIALALCHAWRMPTTEASAEPFRQRKVPRVKRS
jgi:crossover junction endodeoxyribonuclease RuvC